MRGAGVELVALGVQVAGWSRSRYELVEVAFEVAERNALNADASAVAQPWSSMPSMSHCVRGR